MSIRLYSGIMGSGKTYRVVYELMNTDLLDRYFIFHNIEGLRIENKYLKEYGKQAEFNPPDLFTYEYQQQLTKQIKDEYNRNILWIIEECDKIGFDKNTQKLKEWLSMHRHLGQDIYLISQSKWNIAKEYANLIEVEIQGKRGFVFNQFIYSWFSGGEKVTMDRLPKIKKVYETYKSFHIPEMNKKKSNLWKWALGFFVIAFIGTIYFFFFGIPKKFTDMNEKVKKVHNVNIEKFEQKEIKKNNSNEVNKSYTYAGKIKDQIFLSDQFGNIYPIQHIYKKTQFVSDDQKRSISLLDENLTEYKPTYIKELARRPAGREARPGQASEQAEDDMIKYREMWINIY